MTQSRPTAVLLFGPPGVGKGTQGALLGVIPNVLAAALVISFMGFGGIPLNMMTITIAAISIGIGVDDTIHHMTRFQHEFLLSGSYEQALEASTVDVGRALVITSIVLVAGFLVFLLSSLDSVASFGILLAGTVGLALVADFLLMPALVLTWKPWGPGR